MVRRQRRNWRRTSTFRSSHFLTLFYVRAQHCITFFFFCSMNADIIFQRVYRQARSLQSGLLALLDRVDKVREEHDKLEGENKILQECVSLPPPPPTIRYPPRGTLHEEAIPSTSVSAHPANLSSPRHRYIGSLMATSRITGTSSSHRKSGGRLR